MNATKEPRDAMPMRPRTPRPTDHRSTRAPHRIASRMGLYACAVLAVGLLACGSAPPPVVTPVAPVPAVHVDADAAALLPYGPLALANLDTQAIASSTLGGDLLNLLERAIPFSQEADFQVRRDLQRALVATYSFTGADFLGVLSGSFKPQAWEAAAAKNVTPSGNTVVASTYAGHRIFTVANTGFCVLSANTAFVGTETALRRALDRIAAGTVRRELPMWMASWTLQPGYPVVFSGDFTRQSWSSFLTTMVPALRGMQYVRGVGRFNPDQSFGLSAALTYGSAPEAGSAAASLAAMERSPLTLFALRAYGLEPVLRNLKVSPAGNDVQITTVVDEKQARNLLNLLLSGLANLPTPPSSSTPAPRPTPGGTSI